MLGGNKIGDEGVEALASENHLTNLTLLSLGFNEISDKGAEALASGNLTNLITLKVYDNSINYRGTQTLTSGNLIRLTSLIFNYCSIDSTLHENVLPSLRSRYNKRKIGEESDSKLSEVRHLCILIVKALNLYNFTRFVCLRDKKGSEFWAKSEMYRLYKIVLPGPDSNQRPIG